MSQLNEIGGEDGLTQPRVVTWLDVELRTKLDMSKNDNDRVRALVVMNCLMLDEVSMRKWRTQHSTYRRSVNHQFCEVARSLPIHHAR